MNKANVTENIISSIAIIRARLAKIGQATMLLAPQASAVVDTIESQLDEVCLYFGDGDNCIIQSDCVYSQLQRIVSRMADNSVRLLLDRPEREWEFGNDAVRIYQKSAVTRSSVEE